MPGAGAVRAGQAYVEITADNAKLKSVLDSSRARLSGFASSLKQIGNTVIGVGIFEGLKSLTQGAFSFDAFKNLDDQLKNIQAVANPTADGMKNISDSINSISIGTGTGPAEVAGAFTELQKAGLATEIIMGGAAKSVVQFAKVGGISATEAATTMADALNAFNREALTSTEVVNTLSRAADASSIGIAQIAQSFAQSAAVFGASNQKMKDLATGIGILGNAGIKGSDAGTSLKTFMVSLLAPTEKAASTISELGINTRDASGEMLPIRDLIGEIGEKVSGLDSAGRDAALKNIFGTDALRAAIILLQGGASGFDEFQNKMDGSLSVAQKFQIIMSSIGNKLGALYASVQRVGVAIGTALEGPLKSIITEMTALGNGIAVIIKNNPKFIVQIAKIGAGITATVVAAGAAYLAYKTMAVGVAAVSFVYGAFLIALNAVNAVLVLLPSGVAAFGLVMAATATKVAIDSNGISNSLKYISTGFDDLKKSGVTAFNGIVDAVKSGDLGLAGDIAMAGLNLAFQEGILTLKEIWIGFKDWLETLFADIETGFSAKIKKEETMLKNTLATPGGFLRGIAVNIGFAVKKKEYAEKHPEISPEKLQEAFEKLYNELVNPEGFKKNKEAENAAVVDLVNKNQEAANKRKEDNDKILAPFREAVEKSKNALGKLAETAKKNADSKSEDDFGRIGLRDSGMVDFTIGKRQNYLYDGEFEIGQRKEPRDIFLGKVTTQGFFNTSGLFGQNVGSTAVTTQKETLKATKETARNTKRTADAMGNLDFEGAG